MPRKRGGNRTGNSKWKRKGRMMTEREWYASNLHFSSEVPYSEYKKIYKYKKKLGHI